MILVVFAQRFPVEDNQQLPVTVYDYYQPGTHLEQCIGGIIKHIIIVECNIM